MNSCAIPSRLNEVGARTNPRTVLATLVLALALVVFALSAACPAPAPQWVVVWRVGDEQFRCLITRPADAARISRAIHDRSAAGIPLGRVRFGPAENGGHFWHLERVRLVGFTVEIYDGRPSDIDADIFGWIRNVKRYGPWSARPVWMQRVR